MQTTYTLAQAMDAAPDDTAACRRQMDAQFAPGLFDKAVEHHAARRLRADADRGTTRDRDGERSRFVSYDWGQHYAANPSHVFFDFFRGHVCNSVSRLARGLGA